MRKPPKDAGTWVRQWSAQHKREYFFNSETKDTTWRLPEGGLEVLDPKCVAAATSSVPCAIFCLFAQPFSPAFCLAAAEAVLHAGDGNWRMYCNSALAAALIWRAETAVRCSGWHSYNSESIQAARTAIAGARVDPRNAVRYGGLPAAHAAGGTTGSSEDRAQNRSDSDDESDRGSSAEP